ncbi:MAG: HNH endonuclease, partial [Myxococcales bacterium]|nr:HNH endonuclease [Myxococcales bacterium]
PFFFRLKKGRNAVCGYGIFARFAQLPIWLAWDAFGPKNGVANMQALIRRAAHYRRGQDTSPSTLIGCIIITQPVFFPEDAWIPEPGGWQPNIVSGKGYPLTEGAGLALWHRALARDVELNPVATPAHPSQPTLPGMGQPAVGTATPDQPARFGAPQLVRPRLGQGAFRLAVTEAYDKACAVTREHSLPVIEAAHIKPYSDGGEHIVTNGLALRSDIHRLFDKGYVTVDEQHRFVVSNRLREDFDNGKIYYERQGQALYLPGRPDERPDAGFLAWHREQVFRG